MAEEGVTNHSTNIDIFTAVRTSNLIEETLPLYWTNSAS
jgi:hypothetical protein